MALCFHFIDDDSNLRVNSPAGSGSLLWGCRTGCSGKQGYNNHSQLIYIDISEFETRPVYLRIFDAEVWDIWMKDMAHSIQKQDLSCREEIVLPKFMVDKQIFKNRPTFIITFLMKTLYLIEPSV